MAEAEDDAAEAVAFEEVHLVIDERAAGDFDEGLGSPSGGGTEPRGHAAGEEGDGNFLYVLQSEHLK